jgi:hypothetical protein
MTLLIRKGLVLTLLSIHLARSSSVPGGRFPPGDGCRWLLNRTAGHWHSVKLFEHTLTVRSERSRASGEVEELARRASGGLRLRCATLRPNGKGRQRVRKCANLLWFDLVKV